MDTKQLAEDIQRVMELDGKRTQGEWFFRLSNNATPFVFRHTDSELDWDYDSICYNKEQKALLNANFIASAPLMADIIRRQNEVIRELVEALQYAQPCVKPMRIQAVDLVISAAIDLAKPLLKECKR